MLDLVRLEKMLILMQDRCTVAPNVPQARKSFWTHPMVLQGYEAQVEARFRPFKDSANLDAR
jgi:hypothetical protein